MRACNTCEPAPGIMGLGMTPYRTMFLRKPCRMIAYIHGLVLVTWWGRFGLNGNKEEVHLLGRCSRLDARV